MTTQQTDWKEYTGSDEQIAELINCKFIVDNDEEEYIYSGQKDFDGAEDLKEWAKYIKLKAYWLIPEDPLREMKIRQAMTGQPVWVKGLDNFGNIIGYVTTKPDWNIPNAKYSFTEFE